MFEGCKNFDQPIENWNLSGATNLNKMFLGATSFNQALGKWSVGNVLDFSSMFEGATAFNHPIADWDVSSGENFVSACVSPVHSFYAIFLRFSDTSFSYRQSKMFHGATAMERAPIFTHADLDTLVDMYTSSSTAWLSNGFDKLYGAEINEWDVSHIADFSGIFQGHNDFTESVADWDVSRGTTFSSMFEGARLFDGSLGKWDVSRGSDFSSMFKNAEAFSGVKSETENVFFDNGMMLWKVSGGQKFVSFDNKLSIAFCSSPNFILFSLQTKTSMFENAVAFNQNIGSWNVASGTDFVSRLWHASFVTRYP